MKPITLTVKNDQVKGDPSQGVDNIRTDIENVIGGPFDDVVTGSAAANRLEGRAGRDVLRGLGGDDALEGDAGNDALDGGPGVDRCVQGPGTGPRTSCEH